MRNVNDYLYGKEGNYSNCRLIDADESQVEQILAANMEQVRRIQAASQKVREMIV